MKSIFAFLCYVAAVMMNNVSAQVPNEVPNSHLTCRRGLKLNENNAFQAKVQLQANEMQLAYSLNKCKISYRKAALCVPSTKGIIETTSTYPFNYLTDNIFPQTLFNDFICYKMKCKPQQLLEFQGAADQFGYKRIRLTNRFKLCVPAWKLDKAGGPIVLG